MRAGWSRTVDDGGLSLSRNLPHQAAARPRAAVAAQRSAGAGFVDELASTGRSRQLVKKIVNSLSAIASEARVRGYIAHNPVREGKRDNTIRLPREIKRESGEPVEMPTKDELRVLIADASGRWRPLILTAIFTGLRSSELRSLTWEDVDLREHVLRVRRRADQWGVFEPLKTKAGHRDVPLAPIVASSGSYSRTALARSRATPTSCIAASSRFRSSAD